MTTLDDVLREVAAWDASRDRSQQIALGASDVYGCRAQKVLKLAGVPQSNPRLSWEALVGTAIHGVAERAAPVELIIEQRFEYRGVWATVDRFDPGSKRLTDLKSKNTKADITKVAKVGPSRQQIAQVNVGAAALIAAGYEVTHVELLFLPRAGDHTGAWLWESPFDRGVADEAVEWFQMVNGLAAWESVESAPKHLDGLRDEGEFFCSRYCGWFSVCKP